MFMHVLTTVKFGTFSTDVLERPQNVPKNRANFPTTKLGHGEDIRTFEALFFRDGIHPFLVFKFFTFLSPITFNQASQIINFFYLENFPKNPIPVLGLAGMFAWALRQVLI